MNDLVSKIQKMAMTRTDSSIADYVLDHLDTVGFQTSTNLAMAVGVSDASVIRFIRKLGFGGYGEFRNAMNRRIAEQYQSQKDLSPSEKYDFTRDSLHKDSLISDVTRYTLDNLQQSLSKLDNATVDKIVDTILNSDRKYVVGFRGTACCAQYMASKLILLLPHIIPITHADATAVENVVDITAQDCLILYSFPRYSELCLVLMKMARERGAKIILITDRLTNPLAALADSVAIAHVKGLGFTNSYVVPLSVSEVILLAISGRSNLTSDARIRELDKVIGSERLY